MLLMLPAMLLQTEDSDARLNRVSPDSFIWWDLLSMRAVNPDARSQLNGLCGKCVGSSRTLRDGMSANVPAKNVPGRVNFQMQV
jgi:hypothetical protein